MIFELLKVFNIKNGSIINVVVKIMLGVSADLSTAYFMKEDFLAIINIKDSEKQKKKLDNWILQSKDYPIERFKQCSETITNWYLGINNSLITPFTNDFTEGQQ